MTVDELRKHYGTQAEAARVIGVTGALVSIWRRNRTIPYLRQLDIERLTGGALKAGKRDRGRQTPLREAA